MNAELDIATRAVRAGRGDLTELGVHALPIDFSTAYPFTDLDQATASYDALVAGAETADNPIYARLLNPTVARFERGIAELEETAAAVAFSSGMAALTAVLLAAREDGSHIVGTRPIYGMTDHLLSSGLLGFDVSWVAPEEVADAIRSDTALVITETPTNPTIDLVDLQAVVRAAGQVPVVVDSTFATPVLQRPAKHGVTLVMHSATKFIGGHADVIAGVIATGPEWAQRLRKVRVATGAVLHPLGAYLLHRGLPTLPLRIERAQATAQVLAERLSEHPGVARVHYPSLPGGDPHGLLGRQMDGPGPMLAFEVSGGYEMADRLLHHLDVITTAASLGSTDTLIQHPAGLTHRIVSAEALAQGRISAGLLRLSVGLEAADDLWKDLGAALRAAKDFANVESSK
jgi:methionine-gamma-lyase